ncbi:hypothetical protein BDV96DRAFT_485026 [Lophiotrema nucula]|uniref:Allergen n=1 Tax=Lophiotrema nucula TaxID=690887 RepID=A0A6A5ZPI5_9PLEO|nr:hypothetical protein BDV96DRAFT_485026 [Lophiotrema nucula]
MDKAKAAVSDFMKKAGHHDTTVHETVAPAVKHETVKQHEHENVTTAVDKEVHQDHYHRTVQPVHDKEVLPEQHQAKLGSVQHREFDHRDVEGSKHALATDQAQFRDQQVVHDKTHSQSAGQAIGGEHVHHHIHETIQPVLKKETIQPSVVHTTVPIHETHHQAAKHHETSTLPPVNLSDYKQKGGVLGGREERYDGFEGVPKNIGGTLEGLKHSGNKDSRYASETGSKQSMHGDFDPLDGERRHGGTHSSRDPSHTTGAGGLERTAERGLEHERSHNTGVGSGTTGSTLNSRHETGGDYQRGSEYDNTTAGTQKKPGLMSKLNPMVDSNGDGKAGFMK